METRTKAMRAVSAVSAVLTVFLLMAATRPAPPCETDAVAEWALLQEESGTLPTTLSGVQMYAPQYRSAILALLPVETRVRLWREHLTASLANSDLLTAEQRALIAEINGKLELYLTDGTAGRTRATLDRLDERVRATFSAEVGRPIFIDFGDREGATPVREARAGLDAGVASLTTMVGKIGNGGEALDPVCNCRANSDWCGLWSTCAAGGCLTNIFQGCGTLHLYWCDGMCVLDA